MFCACLNNPDEKHPNVNICPICMGHPGTLPVINKEAVRKVIKTGLALNCQIPEHSEFDRKNYFYPDLPKGYQISQLYFPLCKQGFLKIDNKKIRIKKIHLEEDTGKLIHKKDYSLVDFNRAGIPLMELVTEPDLTSAKEARKFAEELQIILRYLGVSDADMEKGQMRIEVNISLTKDIKKLGTKVEIKNLNSFRAVEKGIDYEIERQTKVLKIGKEIIQETRGWNENKEATVSQREKEESHDYRYFPEPDLPPLYHTKEFINEIRAEIPELPQQRRERFKREYNLLEKEIEIFIQNKELGEYFEKVVSELPPNLPKESLFRLIKLSSNYLITDLQGLLKGILINSSKFLITAENFAEFIVLIYEGKISSKIAKIILEEMFKAGTDPSNIIEEKELIQLTNEAEIEKIIQEVLIKNPKAIADYKNGKENAFQFLIGQIMAQTKGKANPQIVQKNLTNFLKKV
jgi:aspartyl-tRNA(Asn)/glutamyl-tRNA(Gln) amidotransferase subunit B